MTDTPSDPFCFAAAILGSFLSVNLIPMHVSVVVGSWAAFSVFGSAQLEFKEVLSHRA